MYVFVSFIMAVLPAALLLYYYYRQDKRKPEPKSLLLKVFLLGVAGTIPVSIVEYFASEVFFDAFSGFPVFESFLQAFVVAAFLEEFFKMLVVMKFAFNNPHFDEVMDGVVYAIVASLGFACFENVVYVIDSGWTTALIRAFTAVPMHAAAAGIMGFYIGKAKFLYDEKLKNSTLAKGFWIAVGLHGAYDFLIFLSPKFSLWIGLGIIPLVILSLIWLQKKIKDAIDDDIANNRI